MQIHFITPKGDHCAIGTHLLLNKGLLRTYVLIYPNSWITYP